MWILVVACLAGVALSEPTTYFMEEFAGEYFLHISVIFEAGFSCQMPCFSDWTWIPGHQIFVYCIQQSRLYVVSLT